MIGRIQRSKFSRYFWLIVLIQMINGSIDARDIGTINGSENLLINDQESFVELLVEQVFGFKKAIPETEDDDSDENSKKNQQQEAKVYAFTEAFAFESAMTELCTEKESFTYLNELTNGFTQYEVPPPETLCYHT